MRIKGVVSRWRAVRRAEHDAEVATAVAKVMAPMVGARLVGPAALVPVCGIPVRHDVTCDCRGMGGGICGKRMTRKQFIWDGRCTDCVTAADMLAKM